MSTEFKSHARAFSGVAAFALAACLSPCSWPQQASPQKSQTPAQPSSTSADQKGEDSRWWIRVRGDARTAAFTEDGVLKKGLPRMPRLSEVSPDGSRLLEVRFTDGASDIYVADADGSHAQRIARGVSVEDEAHWSRDGARILYASSRGGYQVFEADARGNVLRKLAGRGGLIADPLYTPDGRISYILRRVDTKQKYPISSIVVTDGASERAVVENRPISTYAWDSSGRRLAFGTHEDGGLIVMRDLAGGAERVVRLRDIDERLGGFAAHDIRWRPDGGAIAFLLSFAGGREQGDKESMFGERQLFVLYPEGRAKWFDVETPSSFDWIPADDTPK